MNINKLNQIVEESSLTKKEIADACDLARTSLDRILHGEDFKVSNLEKLAYVLNVPVWSFFTDEDPGEDFASKAVAATQKIAALEDSVAHLKDLVAEKERTIQILLSKQQ
jgi:transcriptional regulator with XRE-family HTH domain